jgi:hypothetical protein
MKQCNQGERWEQWMAKLCYAIKYAEVMMGKWDEIASGPIQFPDLGIIGFNHSACSILLDTE